MILNDIEKVRRQMGIGRDGICMNMMGWVAEEGGQRIYEEGWYGAM
jgi:hypothetical protein